MEIKPGEASTQIQTSSETDSESDISLEKIAEKKKKKETQGSEMTMHLHYYTAILHDKPLGLKQNGAPVQEKGKKKVLHDQEMHRRDLPVSPTVAYRATAYDGAPVATNSATVLINGQLVIAPFFEQGDSKVPEMTDSVTVADAPCAVDLRPLGESVPTVGPAYDARGQYSAFSSPATATFSSPVNVPHLQPNAPMPPPFTTITQRERLNALRLDDARNDQTVRISYPFQRWFGEHSVKVSLRRDSLFESAMVLQPSDVRASDALARQLEHWPKQTPHILHPDSGEDEQQRGQQQREQEEDQ